MILDPNDPHASLYDVDDGIHFHCLISQSNSGLATTVITLSDWYHGLATNLFPNPTNATPCVFKFLTGLPKYQTYTNVLELLMRLSSTVLAAILVDPRIPLWQLFRSSLANGKLLTIVPP